MNALIFLVILLILAYFGLMAYRDYQNNLDQPEETSGLEEWNCPECGFHVQVGESCIYCGTAKPDRL